MRMVRARSVSVYRMVAVSGVGFSSNPLWRRRGGGSVDPDVVARLFVWGLVGSQVREVDASSQVHHGVL